MIFLAALLTHDALLVRLISSPMLCSTLVGRFLAAVGGVVFASCSRGWAADGTVPAVVTAEIAAGTAAAAAAAAAAAMRAAVATSPRVADAAAQGASTVDALADCGHDLVVAPA